MTKRIGIIGPESSGKSTLAKALAVHFGGIHIAEYARSYVEQLPHRYTYADVEQIARKQIEQLQAAYDTEFVFFDTDLIITKVWFEYCYGSCPAFVEEALLEEKLDLYLLCLPDLPFEDDPVREHPNEREEFLKVYQQGIELLHRPYAIISGTGNSRTEKAIEAVATLQ